MNNKYNVVDLFCGCGGSAIGIHNTNQFNTIFALDKWEVATNTYKHNFKDVKVLNEDIHNLDENIVKELVGDNKIDVVIGGVPCQGFSLMTRMIKTESYSIIRDKRNHLFLEFLRICNMLNPTFIIMENVVGILNMKNNKGVKIIEDIEKAYNELGYHLRYQTVDIQKLGLPQIRKRVIFVASRDKELLDKFRFPDTYTNISNSIENAISDLENEDYENEFKYTKDYNDISEYSKSLRDVNDKTYQDIFHIPRNKELFNARVQDIKNGCCMKDLPDSHPFKTKAKFTNAYNRGHYNGKALTITNPYKNMTIHPKYNRLYSIREIARLQSFPDSYEFLIDEYGTTNQGQLLANAIPPILTEYIFKEIKELLDIKNKRKDRNENN